MRKEALWHLEMVIAFEILGAMDTGAFTVCWDHKPMRQGKKPSRWLSCWLMLYNLQGYYGMRA